MAKKKFYAVKIGRIPGIYQTWDETEKQVKGFPSAEFKSFQTEEEAFNYISNADSSECKKRVCAVSETNKSIDDEIKNLGMEKSLHLLMEAL